MGKRKRITTKRWEKVTIRTKTNIEEIKKLVEDGIKTDAKVTLGIPEIDNIVKGGLKRGEIAILPGIPNQGKSEYNLMKFKKFVDEHLKK